MLITKLILKNWIGIYNGLGLKEIELNFPDTLNNINILVGANGAGKTTILSALNPFAETQDIRSNPILEGKEGYKEIHIVSNNDLYIIKHYYKKQNKSYISKNNEELNETGGIRSFKDIIKQEFNIDEDYFKIGRIGTNVTNFIDFTTGDRKKYISKFQPDVEDYLNAYKIALDKFKDTKKQIKIISDQIQNIQPKEFLEENKSELESQLTLAEKSLEKINDKLSKLDAKLEELGYSENLKNLKADYLHQYNTAKKELTELNNNLQKYLEKYPQLAELSNDKIVKLIQSIDQESLLLNQDLNYNKKELENLNIENIESNNELNKKEEQLEQLILDNSLEELEELLEEKSISLEGLKKVISGDNEKFKKYKSLNLEDLLKIKSLTINIKDTLLNIKSNYNETVITKFLELVNSDKAKNIEEDLKYFIRLKDKLKDEYNKIDTRIKLLEQNLDKYELLKKRPKNCIINSCEFIKDAISYENIENDIKDLQDELESININLNNNNDTIEFQTLLNEIDKYMVSVWNNSTKFINIIRNSPLSFEFENFSTFCNSLVYSDEKINKIFNLSNLENFYKVKNDYNIVYDQITNIQEKIKYLKEKQSIIDNLNTDVENISEKIQNISIKISDTKIKVKENEASITKNNTKVNVLQTISNMLTKISEKSDEYEESSKLYTDILEKFEKINGVLDEIKEQTIVQTSARKSIKKIKDDLEKYIIDLGRLKDFNERKENLEKNYETIELVKLALDPLKGIPIYFIGSYLKETSRITNELLDLAYEGKFRIGFQVDDKDFFIRVQTADGTIKEDIKKASQGEVALTTISLSLSMIEQNFINKGGKFNILYLDEIDSTLDTTNRTNFISMLERQIERLGIDQVFIISHNERFNNYPVNLILLKDHNLDLKDKLFMQDKNIIFDYYSLNKVKKG